MNMFFKRAFAVMAAAVMTAGISSCSGKKSSESSDKGHNMVGGDLGENVNIEPEDMPYGSHMAKLPKGYDGVPIDIEYDRDFLTEDEGKAVSNYLSAIGKKDSELFDEISFPPVKEELLSMAESADTAEYLSGLYESVKAYAGEDFEISMLIINGAEDTGHAVFDSMLQNIGSEAEVTARKFVTVDAYYDTPESSGCQLYSKAGRYIQLYIYTINGKPYVMG